MDKAIGVGMNKIATGAASPVLLIAGSAVVGGFQSEADLLEDILLFADTDVAAVFHAIAHYHPRLVVVQRDLLPTARAAEIIGRIRTDPDPAVSHVQIRVLSDVHAYIQLVQDRVGLDEAIAARGDRLPPEYDGRRFSNRRATHRADTLATETARSHPIDRRRGGDPRAGSECVRVSTCELTGRPHD